MANNIYITIEGENYLTFSQARSMSKCFDAYSLNADEQPIQSLGYSPESDTFWILLSNGIEIISEAGNRVEYTTVDEEHNVMYWDDYEAATAFIISNPLD